MTGGDSSVSSRAGPTISATTSSNSPSAIAPNHRRDRPLAEFPKPLTRHRSRCAATIRHVFNGNNRRVEIPSLEDLPHLPRAPDAEQRAAITVWHRDQRAARPDDRGRRAGGGL